MKHLEQQPSSPNWLRRFGSMLTSLREVSSRFSSRVRVSEQRKDGTAAQSPPPPALKIAGYSLVLMDADGQVIWTRDWDSGGVFEFGPRQRLSVYCGFTNHTPCETEISEYEIELMDEDGTVVQRFGDSFGDSVIIPPGESKHFPAEWRM